MFIKQSTLVIWFVSRLLYSINFVTILLAGNLNCVWRAPAMWLSVMKMVLSSGQWFSLPPMLNPRRQHACTKAATWRHMLVLLASRICWTQTRDHCRVQYSCSYVETKQHVSYCRYFVMKPTTIINIMLLITIIIIMLLITIIIIKWCLPPSALQYNDADNNHHYWLMLTSTKVKIKILLTISIIIMLFNTIIIIMMLTTIAIIMTLATIIISLCLRQSSLL